MHPEKLAKLRTEILGAVPNGAPTYDDVRNLKYCKRLPRSLFCGFSTDSVIVRACLNETLRLFPPVPINRRCSTHPGVLPCSDVDTDGVTKPIYMPGPDTTIVYLPLTTQRRKDIWGDDADEFVPERWIDVDRLKDITADPFRFVPFNAGPRICPGQVSLT